MMETIEITQTENVAVTAEADEEEDDFIESVECNEDNAEIIMADSKLMKQTPVVYLGHHNHVNATPTSYSTNYLIKCRSSTCSNFYKDLASLLTHEMKDHTKISSNLDLPIFKIVTLRSINIYLDDCSKRPRFYFRPRRRGRRRDMKQHSSNEQEDENEDEKRDPTIIPGEEDSDDSDFNPGVDFNSGELRKRGRPRKTPISNNPPKIYKCTVCSETFPKLVRLRAHINQTHPTPSKIFRCKICEVEFPAEHKLRLHIKSTKHYQPFYCSICPEKFTSVPNLKSHFLKSHLPSGVKPNQCTVCLKSWNTFTLARKHERLVHRRGRFNCSICAKSFYNLSQCAGHEARHDRQRPRDFPCSFCERKFFTKYCRDIHENRMHKKIGRESWVYCQKCGRGFKDENGMKYHVCSFHPTSMNFMYEPEVIVNADGQIELCPDPLRINQSEKTVVVEATSQGRPSTSISSSSSSATCIIRADVDGMIIKEVPVNPITSLTSIKVDVENMTIKRPPQDDLIDIQYEGTLPARFNILPEEPDNDEAKAPAKGDEEYILPGKSSDAPSTSKSKPKKKNKQSKSKSSSTHPTLIKIPKTGTTCLHCSKTFAQREGLKKHVLRFNNKLRGVKFICDFPLCGKALASPHNLKLHLESHTIPCKFKCKECGSTFRTSHGHLFHMRRHAGDKPYKCSTEGCNAAFVGKQHLLIHELRNHIKIKNFACSYCDKKFLLKSQLIQHERTHTGEKPLLCKYCGLGFGRYSSREKHQNRHLKYLEKETVGQVGSLRSSGVVQEKSVGQD